MANDIDLFEGESNPNDIRLRSVDVSTSGARLLTGAGKRKLNSAGKRRVSNGRSSSCCCCPSCSNCTDAVPSAYIVTFAGTTACNTTCGSCAPFPGPNTSYRNDNAANIDGTYTVPCTTACQWHTQVSNAGWSWSAFGTGNTTCTGAPASTINYINIDMVKFTSGVKKLGIDVTAGFGGSGRFFTGTISVDTCNSGAGYSFTNGYTTVSACDLFTYLGSATATPV